MSKKHRRHRHEETIVAQQQKPEQSQDIKMEKIAYYIVLIMLVLIAYVNSLNNAFVSDDTYGILNNPLVFKWQNVTNAPFRFLQPIVYYIISNTFGLVPFWFRVWNILAHIGNVTLIFAIGSLLATPLVAFFAAAIFAVHPINIEAVSWISGGPYSWYTFFFLLSFFLYIKSKKMPRLYYFSVASFLMACVVGIPAVVLSPLFVLYEYLWGDLKKNWPKMIPFFVLSLIYGIMAVSGIGAREYSFKTDHYQDKTSYDPILQIPVAIASYIQLYFWPSDLTLYHSELNFTVTQFVVKVIIMVIFFLGLLVSFFKRSKLIFFGLSLFIIGLLPTLTPQSIHWVVAERYAYTSIIGFVLVTGYFIAKIPKKYEALMYLLIILALIGLTARTIQRNNEWKNEDNLWVATGKRSPSDPKTHNNLADVYARHGDYKKAAEELIIAIKINPKYADAYHNLANVYQRTGQLEAALNMYQYSLKLNPRLWQAYQNIGSLYYGYGQFASAEAYMKKAVELNPTASQLYAFTGIILIQENKKDEAKQYFQMALKLDPKSQIAKDGLAAASK